MGTSWENHQNACSPTTAEGLLFEVASVMAKGSVLRWRGQERADWPLQPSLARTSQPTATNAGTEALRDREFSLLDHARHWPAREFAGSVTDQEIMCVLQHHGTPTTLLDVTADPHVALWFACRAANSSRSGDSPGVIFAIEVGDWPELRTDAPWHPTYDDLGHPGGFEYRNRVTAERSFRVLPTRPDARMIAQRAELLHLVSDYDGQSDDHVTPIIVRKTLKPELRRILERNLGLTHAHLFPDVAGFALFARDSGLLGP